MQTTWDYTNLAKAYLKRPNYASQALDSVFKAMGLAPHSRVADIGAGVAHLTLELLQRNFRVDAVEPNDAMRQLGQERTSSFKDIQWFEATGEATHLPQGLYDLVSFGSSFNVCDRNLALREAVRILKPQGWFLCLWNHRDLEDPIQARIETIIRHHLPNYTYGSRREDQSKYLSQSSLFDTVHSHTAEIIHSQAITDVLEAWHSHGTLQRQAGKNFKSILKEIEYYLHSLDQVIIQVPYITSIWYCQVKP